MVTIKVSYGKKFRMMPSVKNTSVKAQIWPINTWLGDQVILKT
jgi:hypothetical protein